MNGKILLAILAFFFSNNTFAQKGSTGITKTKQSATEIAQLKDAMQRFDNALMRADTEELKRLLSDKLQMVHSNGMVETKEALLKNIKTKKLVYKTIKRAINKEISVSDARMVLTECQLDVTGILEGKEFSVKLNTKEDWISENEEWKLIRRESKDRE